MILFVELYQFLFFKTGIHCFFFGHNREKYCEDAGGELWTGYIWKCKQCGNLGDHSRW
jgi:hypothetical protein